MNMPLLATKLSTPPSRPGLIARPHLIARLNEGLTAGLTLVSAPAGFGKTTLVAEWLRGSQVPSAWLSLDEGDNDPARFFAYLLAALQRIDGEVGRAAQAMLQVPQPPPAEALLTSLINDLVALSCPFVLILDDYHVIHMLPVHQQLAFLLEHRPSQMHLVIATREDPPFPLARLRGQGQVIEIRQADLRFSAEEAAGFLRRAMRLDLGEEAVVALHQRTEGWIAGLQLAALSIQGQEDVGRIVGSFAGSHRYVLDYLIEEVFQRQPPELQGFLLQTAILDRMCGALCDAVTAVGESHRGAAGSENQRVDESHISHSQAVLDHLDHANLFVIPLDGERRWYRYHRLFAELLRHRAWMDLGEQAVSLLHHRASAWYAANGLLPEAVQHALAGRDWDTAARLISAAASGLLQRGEIVTLQGWCAALPPEVVSGRARLCLDYAWPLLLAGQADAAEPLLMRAAELAPAEDPPPDGNLAAFQGQLAAAQSYLARARGDLRRSAEMAHVALALLPETDSVSRSVVGVNLGMAYWHSGRVAEAEPILREALAAAQASGNEHGRLAARIFLARVSAVRGELREAARACQQIAAEGSPNPITALAYLDLACLAHEWNDLVAAAEYLRQGTRLAELSGNAEFRLAADLLRARIQAACDGLPAALQAIQSAQELTRSQDLPALARGRIAAVAVEVALGAGDLATAEQWASGIVADADAHPFYRFLGLTPARLMIARGQRQAAAQALQRSFETAARAGWGYGMIAVRVWQAVAANTPEAAAEFLADALRRAQPQRFIRTFADAGMALAPLLHAAGRRGIAPDYVGEILGAMGAQARLTIGRAAGLIEPLSERELEVLRLLAIGLSNRAIADTLILSPGTVKSHIHHICGKLAVSNRTEAAARARELRLI